jgi:hypothetical protein
MADGSRNCEADIRAAGGGRLSDDEVLEIAEQIQKRRARLVAEGKIDRIDERMAEIAREEGEQARLAAALARKQTALTIIARDRTQAQVNGLRSSGLKAKDAILAVFEGTVRGIANARKSIYATKLAFEARFIGDMFADVLREAPATLKLLRDRRFGADVVREMAELREGGRPGSTGNLDAQKVAHIFAKYAEVSRKDLNALGANIGKLDGWHGPQSYDATKLLRATDAEFVNSIMPRLDKERSFPGMSDDEIIKSLKESYLTIVTGKSNRLTAARTGQYQGPRNLANSAGQHRVWHFKSADDWLAIQEQYGRGHIVTSMMEHQRHAASMAAQMQMLGPNPELMLKSLLDQMQSDIKKDTSLTAKQKQKQINSLTLEGGALSQALAEAQGVTVSVNPDGIRAARILGGWRATQSMAKLGGAVISSISDTVSQAANLKYQGKSLIGSYADQTVGMIKAISRTTGNDEKEIAFLLGEGMDGMLDNIHSSAYANDGMPGAMSSAMTKFFKWSGLTGWTDNIRATGARIMSAHMGKMVSKSFANLPEQYRFVLGQHGIGDAEWSAIRQAEFRGQNGNTYVTPDRIGQLSDDVIRPLVEGEATRSKLARARLNLEMSVRRFFSDEINFGVIETDARSRRFTLRGTKPGTATGEILRLVSQFKGWPIAFSQRVLGRAIYGQRNAGSFDQAFHIGHLVAGLTVAGYIAMTAKDYLRGYDRRKFVNDDGSANLKTLQAAFLQGGGAGIYGDFLFGQVNRFGGGLAETTMGPGLGAAFDLGDLLLKARDGDAKAADGLNYVLQNTPFINLSYARPLGDYLFLNALRENISPGFLDRQRTRRKNDYGQSLIYPQTVQ